MFAYDEDTGEVLYLLMAALTNIPGLTGLTELNPAMLSQFFDQPKEGVMDKQLLKILGLAEDAKPEDAVTAITALQTDLAAEKAKTTQLEADLNTQKQSVATLQAQVSTAGDAGDKQVIAQMQTQITQLTAQANERAVNDLVVAALQAGQLCEATEHWARDLGKKDLAALQAFIEKQPKIAALQGMQTQGKAPAGVAVEGQVLTPEDVATCEAMGISHADFAKTKAAMSA